MPPKKYAFVPMEDEEPPQAPKTSKKSKEKKDKPRRPNRSQDPGRRDQYRKRKADDDDDDRWGDQEPDSDEEAPLSSPRSPKRVKVQHEDPNDRRRPANESDDEEAEARRDILERDALAERLREKDMGKKKDKDHDRRQDSRREKADMADLRLKSRQQYLEKRNPEKLALLRKQVEEETAELESGVKLSRAEIAQFKRNRELLRIAEELAQVDSREEGFYIQDEYMTEKGKIDKERKHDALYKRDYGRDKFVTDHEQWEMDQAAKAKATGEVGRDRSDGGYALVADEHFTPEDFVKWELATKMAGEGEKLRLAAQIEAEEQRRLSIEEARKNLPIYQYRDVFIDAMSNHQVLVVVAETGSGKTTQLTQYLVEAGYTKGGQKIGCTQPRRVAAMSVAKRVSEEMGVRLGNEVGYAVRFESNYNDKTVIQYMTEGLLLRELMGDVELAAYSAIIIDEAHERTVNTDILLALLKDLGKARPELKMIISSATLDAQKFSAFFGDIPILSVPGRRFPVDIYHSQQPEADPLAACVTTVYQVHTTQPLPGDILVFLSGEDDILNVQQRLEEIRKKLGSRIKELIVCPIYGSLPMEQQQDIFTPTPQGTRKVVLATNIAETSLTIDGLKYVIDTGMVKQNVFNPHTSVSSLVVVPCSRASANQRAGRAGRTGPGACFRLFTKYSFYNDMDASTMPEILRTNLTNVVLTLSALGVTNLIDFDFIDKPDPEGLASSLSLLYSLGAFNHKGQLTKKGRQLAELPLGALEAAAILSADKEGVVQEVITIVAMLGESATLYYRPKEKKVMADSAHQRLRVADGGDFLTLLNIFSEWQQAGFSKNWCQENFLDERSLKRARDVGEQLAQLCDRIEVTLSSGPTDYRAIKRALLGGYFRNVAKMTRGGEGYTVIKGKSDVVYVHPSSTVRDMEPPPRFVCFHELATTSKTFMRSVMPIDEVVGDLGKIAPHYFKGKEIDEMKEKKFKSGRHYAQD
jgi:pre-mRNA-splicing factor ATP-dependent RNA helicase DHX16